MTTVDHYKPNLRDIFFQLFEVLEIQRTSLGKGPFASMDEDTARAALEGFLEVLQSTWAPAFAEGDRVGATFDGKGNVTLPPGYQAGARRVLRRRLEQARAAREPRRLRRAADACSGRRSR